jgi:hypothetical protein
LRFHDFSVPNYWISNGGRWNASTTKQVICTIEYVWWWQVFFCKHLLINWQWGEAYFAEKLDYEMSSNVGGGNGQPERL